MSITHIITFRGRQKGLGPANYDFEAVSVPNVETTTAVQLKD